MSGKQKDFWSEHLIHVGIIATAGYWLIESYFDTFIYGVDSYWQTLIWPPWYELWMRLVVAFFFLAASIIIQRQMRQRKQTERKLKVSLAETKQEVLKRQAAEEELKRSLDETKIFAYSVMHDLKGPAIAVHGLTSQLAKRYANNPDKKGQHLCETIKKAAEQIMELVESVNIFISTKENPLHLDKVRLEEVCETLRDEFNAQMLISGINWHTKGCEAEFKADRLLIIRALRNLVDNSLKYGGNAMKNVSIVFTDDHKCSILSVQNDGYAISAENLKKIFNPFERGDVSRDIAGSGLGLAIVMGVAEKHGGRAWVESGEKRGTKFFFSISKNIKTARR